MKQALYFFSLVLVLLFSSCHDASIHQQKGNKKSVISEQTDPTQDKIEFEKVLQKHLQAVSDKDIEALKTTMSPTGKMQLIIQGMEILNTVDSFINFQNEWFNDGIDWTFEYKILNTEVGPKLGIGITETIYREADRDGQPYFNRMNISYALEKTDGKWYVIKDHASSTEKTGDK